MDNGYIRLHRAITAWEWYDDVNTFKVFLHLLLTCNWQEKKWRGHTIYPGQRVVSLATLADETKLSIMQVRNTISFNRFNNTVENRQSWLDYCK